MQPIAGQAGQVSVTVSAHDAYGQSARGMLALSITPTAGGGGGVFDYASLVVLGMWLTGSVRRRLRRY
jgi:hypothetical protein